MHWPDGTGAETRFKQTQEGRPTSCEAVGLMASEAGRVEPLALLDVLSDGAVAALLGSGGNTLTVSSSADAVEVGLLCRTWPCKTLSFQL